MNSQLSLASLFAVVVCVVSLPAIIQIEGREERGRHGAFGHSWLLKCLHACVARREEGGRDTLPAATADQKQNVNRWAWAPMMKPGMAGEPLCLEREKCADSGEFNLL